jgi:hypothetical protein
MTTKRAGQLHITAATTTLAHFIWLRYSFVKESVMLAPFVLPRVGMCPSPRKNVSFDSGSGHVVPSGKTNGVVAANVSCNRQQYWDKNSAHIR